MPPDAAAQKACSYILNRIQIDPDLRYVAGPMTETFALLCAAQAEYTGEPAEQVATERAKDLQPEHRRRRADGLKWREAHDLLLSVLEDHSVGCGGRRCGGCLECAIRPLMEER